MINWFTDWRKKPLLWLVVSCRKLKMHNRLWKRWWLVNVKCVIVCHTIYSHRMQMAVLNCLLFALFAMWWLWRLAPKQSKHCNLHPKGLHHEANNIFNNLFRIAYTAMKTTYSNRVLWLQSMTWLIPCRVQLWRFCFRKGNCLSNGGTHIYIL